jgi:quercetin dioxygenase-like cupin family protein
MSDATVIPDIRAEVEIPTDGILSRTVHSSERARVVVFGFDAGQELSEHTASMPAIVEILDGEADVLLGDTHHRMGPGAWAHMPAGLRHAVRATTQLRMLLVLLPGSAVPADPDS